MRWRDPELGAVLAGGVHPDRRGDGPDRPARRLGAAPGAARPVRAGASAGSRARPARLGEPLRAAVPRGRLSSSRSARVLAETGRRPQLPRARDHREHAAAGRDSAWSRRSRRCATLGVRDRDRRLRHRLLVARLPAHGCPSTRSRSTARSCATSPSSPDERRAHRRDRLDGPRAAACASSPRASRRRAAARAARGLGLRRDPGLPGRAADAGRRPRALVARVARPARLSEASRRRDARRST